MNVTIRKELSDDYKITEKFVKELHENSLDSISGMVEYPGVFFE